MANQKYAFWAAGFLFLGMLSCESDKTSEQSLPTENRVASSPTNQASDLPPLSSIPEFKPAASANLPEPSTLNAAGPLASSVVNTVSPQVVSASPQASTNTVASNQSTTLNTPKASKSNVRVNPAHGQPGHDCAVAVGAPLNSAPKAAQASTKPAATLVPQQTSTLAEPATSLGTNTDPKAKINPAHGQPGHVCSVAVGAPLPAN
jgi:hypothetical protein